MDKSGAYKDQLKGNFNIVKGKLQQEFAQLTDDDLTYAEGQEDEFVGRVQKAIGKTREEVISWLEKLTD